ncbi:MAG: N-acetylmuramoyl-L-alanine amidase [Pseudaminobacter sp.]|nr:N-acetylmuramoyl-L-alanine amidase [Pseudaminobacter sp.]
MSGFLPDHFGAEVRVSPNFGPRRDGARPSMIVLHYTGMETGSAAEAWLCNSVSEVSSHYLVHEDGRIVQMVREGDRAWHAGKSSWCGVTDINSQSIGIEIVNPGHGLGYPDFPKVQIRAVIELCLGIIARHAIRPEMVLAHSDVATGRKVDPGEKFPWPLLAKSGVGHFVKPARRRNGVFLQPGSRGAEVETLQSMLMLYGYDVEITGFFEEKTETVVAAFQRHFRPRRIDGIADPATIETLRRLLSGLPGGTIQTTDMRR